VVKEGLKNAYTSFFVGRGRRDGLWGALSEGGGIILVPAILLSDSIAIYCLLQVLFIVCLYVWQINVCKHSFCIGQFQCKLVLTIHGLLVWNVKFNHVTPWFLKKSTKTDIFVLLTSLSVTHMGYLENLCVSDHSYSHLW